MRTIPSRRLWLISGLTVALSLAWAGTRTADADALDDIAKAGVVKIGIFEDFPPFSSAGPDLKSQGYDIDVAELIAKALGVKPDRFLEYRVRRVADVLQRKPDVADRVYKDLVKR